MRIDLSLNMRESGAAERLRDNRDYPSMAQPGLSARHLIRPIHVAVDAALLFIAWWLAFWLRFNLDMPAEYVPVAWLTLPWMLAAYLVVLVFGNVYRQVWRYVSISELRQLGICVAIG